MNMELNKHVIVATLGLATIGYMKHVQNPNVAQTPILVGSFVFMFALSALDLFGGMASKLASGLAILALVNGALTQIDAATISNLANAGKPTKPKKTGSIGGVGGVIGNQP